MYFSKNIVNCGVNNVTDSSTDDIQWDMSFMQHFEEPFGVGSEYEVGHIHSLLSLVNSDLMRFEQLRLYKIQLVDEFILFQERDSAVCFVGSIEEVVVDEFLSELLWEVRVEVPHAEK